MPVLNWLFPKGETEKSLKATGVAPVQRPANEVDGTAGKIHAAGKDVDEWDVVDDPHVEARVTLLAEGATRAAREEAARQQAARHRLLQEMQIEARRIAQEERVARAALVWRANARASVVARDLVFRQLRQAHEQIDQLIHDTCCWRCGQLGRLPVEDVSLLGSTAYAGQHAAGDDKSASQLVLERKAAILNWRRYNERRLEAEKLRLDSWYHPQLSDRFQQTRDCEVCGSRGVFHNNYLFGELIQVRQLNGSRRGEGDIALRFELAMMHACTEIPGRVYGTNWVPVLQLTRAQAKEWVKDPHRKIYTREWLDWRARMDEWEKGLADGSIKPFRPDPASPYWWGRTVESHVKRTWDIGDRKEILQYMSAPVQPFARDVRWPETSQCYAREPDPVRWMGGPSAPLFIKPGVEYAPEAQDPISKQPRMTGPRAIDESPTIERVRGRSIFWQRMAEG